MGIRTGIARILPSLRENPMRLSVFVQALQMLCEPSEQLRSAKASVEHAELVAAVADGVLAASLPCLPCESSEQLSAIATSPYLNALQRQALVDLMMPVSDGASDMPNCKNCGNTGLDPFGMLCDCPYGQCLAMQAAEAGQSGGLPRSTSAPSSPRAWQVQPLERDSPQPAARRPLPPPLMFPPDMQPADLPPRPASPMSDLGPGRPASPTHYSASPASGRPNAMLLRPPSPQL